MHRALWECDLPCGHRTYFPLAKWPKPPAAVRCVACRAEARVRKWRETVQWRRDNGIPPVLASDKCYGQMDLWETGTFT
jgi:hypothetical protein